MIEGPIGGASKALREVCETYSRIFDNVPTLSLILDVATSDAVRQMNFTVLQSMATLMLSIRCWASDFTRTGQSKELPPWTSPLYEELARPELKIASETEPEENESPAESGGIYLDPPEILAGFIFQALVEHLSESKQRGDKPLATRLKERAKESPAQAQNLGLRVFAILEAYILFDEEVLDDQEELAENGKGAQSLDWMSLVHPSALKAVGKILKST